MEPITETCVVCMQVFEGFDDGVSLEHWPDGLFLTPSGPWVCQDCLPDGFKMSSWEAIDDAIARIKQSKEQES